MFGYTGGFSVYAMKNAELVHTVDSSAAATALADENVKLNFGDDPRHRQQLARPGQSPRQGKSEHQ